MLLPLGALIAVPEEAWALERYLCNGEPLQAEVHAGAVDAPGIPNSAGSPSYSDGRWWWQAADPAHPAFAQRTGGRGDLERYTCEAQA